MKVLFLTPWYPSERDKMAGLFVLKHVEAVQAQGVDVRVIYSQGWRDMWQQWRELKRTWGLPDVVQLNVIQKQGLLALWLKHRYHIPYVIIEHWTGYLPSNKSVKSFGLHTWLMKQICCEAEVVMPVSRQLMDSMQGLGFVAKRWELIDNVVDDFFFLPEGRSIIHEPKTLVNITCFDEPHKNVKGLLRAAKELAGKRQDWRLILIGTGVDYDEVRSYADHLNFPDGQLFWTGELAPQEVAEWLHKADAFVLSSRFETYGVVLAEAAAAGLPIISTPVGIAEELHAFIVTQHEVENHSDVFAQKIEQVLFAQHTVVLPDVDVERFTSRTIGSKLQKLYAEVRNI